MKNIFERIQSSEFLTFSEVLRLKVAIVTIFVSVFIVLTIPLSSFNDFSIDINVFVPMALALLIVLTLLMMIINFNRFSMHTSIITIAILTLFYSQGSNHFYGYIMFFVFLTIVIFYQDILAYLFYGGIITGVGVYYIFDKGVSIIGTNSIDTNVSMMTYLVVLIGFYIIFLIQFLISDNIYEKMNNEWVRMKKILEKYQEFSIRHITEMEEENDLTPVWRETKFQRTVHELSVFINEFFEADAHKISEVIEFYFFLHSQEVEEVIANENASIIARRYAVQFEKYLINREGELNAILFEIASLYKPTPNFTDDRYKYNLNELFHDRIDKLLSLAILYHFLKTEVTQLDKWGNIKDTLTHEEITELFKSKEYREFIPYELVNFYLDNEDLFRTLL
ncbi:hypothetical protein [Candidatus Xianfuyuplasma coldseepsis]|uniref:Uncharacterized protein n=1 Tax=Candidatus Xianfuyuplasma coldseepsis TaxID=2782163 RepID=A0A7L7KSW3_9MOLU|nr:hypothetical protein [Xianfuyuplasma coldseepsis]QMS85034.1 hypothetical protein G4Z02_04450 [Xianfuyuplasma coldseepsis]